MSGLPRAGDWMATYTGRQFWPLDPKPDEVDIVDIGHHLSRICRYGGAVEGYYSVAEHSVLMAGHFQDIGRPHLARWALLHDAAEAYIGDVIRPLKRELTGYAEIEARLERVIWDRFGLYGEMPTAIKRADTVILHDERAQLFRPSSLERMPRWAGESGLGITVYRWPPDAARLMFAHAFDRYFPGWGLR